MTADSLFLEAQIEDENGWAPRITHEHLFDAVHVWFHANGAVGSPYQTMTVGDAAKAFNVSPEFLAAVIDDTGSPFFFAWAGTDAADRVLDEDGI